MTDETARVGGLRLVDPTDRGGRMRWIRFVLVLVVVATGSAFAVPVATAATCNVHVSAPANLQQRLNAAGSGKTVCLSGAFSGDTRPLQGQTITGGKLHGTYDLRAGNVTLRGVEQYGADIGVEVGPHSTVTGSYIHNNSQNGIHAFAQNADWFVKITDNRLEGNGTASLEGHAAGAIKLLAMSKPNHQMGAGATITGNTVTGSHGNGIWLDQSSNASTIANNTIRNSTRHGIRCEICGGNVIINHNTISGSGFDGIDVTSTGVASVTNNTVTDSHDWGITIHMDPRAKKTWPNLGDPHVGWHLHAITLSGNKADRTNGCSLAAVKC